MPKKPLISIIMPVFKHQWLEEAIQSALQQTVDDFEILVGDDSYGDEIEKIIAKSTDPRIKYIKNKPEERGFMRNLNNLIEKSQGEYLKFLWDDDILLPDSCEILYDIFQRTDAKLAFHQRLRIDEKGEVFQAPCSISGTGIVQITKEVFFNHVIKYDYNLLGEPTNFMVEAKAFKALKRPFYIYTIENIYYTDLVLFANFYHAGYTIYGSSKFGSCFRYSDLQGVNPDSPIFSAEIFEREFLRQWCAYNGLLTEQQFMFGFHKRLDKYRKYSIKYPEFIPIIQALKKFDSERVYLSEVYVKAIQNAYEVVEQRKRKKYAS